MGDVNQELQLHRLIDDRQRDDLETEGATAFWNDDTLSSCPKKHYATRFWWQVGWIQAMLGLYNKEFGFDDNYYVIQENLEKAYGIEEIQEPGSD